MMQIHQSMLGLILYSIKGMQSIHLDTEILEPHKNFLDDITHLYNFVDNVLSHFPPLEDCIEVYPAGYVMNPYFDGYIPKNENQ